MFAKKINKYFGCYLFKTYICFFNIYFNMKRLLLVLTFLATFTCWAVEYRACEITYEDGSKETVEVQFPFANDNPNLRIKRNGERGNIDKDLIKFFTLKLNNGESKYLFMGGREFSKNKKKRRKVFTLVEEVNEETGIIIGNLGLSFDVARDRRSDKEIIIFTYIQMYRNYSFSKINEETFYTMFVFPSGGGIRIGTKKYYKKTISKYQKELFPECPDITDRIDYKSMKEKALMAVIDAYKECLN